MEYFFTPLYNALHEALDESEGGKSVGLVQGISYYDTHFQANITSEKGSKSSRKTGQRYFTVRDVLVVTPANTEYTGDAENMIEDYIETAAGEGALETLSESDATTIAKYLKSGTSIVLTSDYKKDGQKYVKFENMDKDVARRLCHAYGQATGYKFTKPFRMSDSTVLAVRREWESDTSRSGFGESSKSNKKRQRSSGNSSRASGKQRSSGSGSGSISKPKTRKLKREGTQSAGSSYLPEGEDLFSNVGGNELAPTWEVQDASSSQPGSSNQGDPIHIISILSILLPSNDPTNEPKYADVLTASPGGGY